MINTEVLNYKIIRKIDEGGMATLYEAVHKTFENRKVAIKILDPILSKNKDIVSRFISEAKIMATLEHPNIVKVLDFEQKNDLMAIIMELLTGKSLKKAIQEDNFSEEKNIEIFKQILDAINYGHSKGVVHRDIKPSNIFLINNLSQAKVLDFGIAKLLNSDTQKTATGLQMGTPMFMSPEQVRGKNIDQRTDIYSLGVLLYYMFAKKTPYDKTESQFDILSKIVNQPIPDLDKFPQINRIIKKATAKNPDERYQNCQEFLSALDDRNEMSGFISINQDFFEENKKQETIEKVPETKNETPEQQTPDKNTTKETTQHPVNQKIKTDTKNITDKKTKKKKKSKLPLILLILLITALLFALTKINIFDSGKTWELYSGGDQNEEIYSLTVDKNNIYAVGFTKSYGSSMNWYLTAISPKGKIIWDRNIDAFNRGDAAHSIIKTNDGNFLIVGGAYKDEDYQAQNRVMKISPKGETIWDKFYGYEGWDEAIDVVAADDGSFIFIFTDTSNPKSKCGIFKIDANGNLIWEQTIGTNADFSPRDIYKVTDEKYIICGKATYSNYTTKAFLAEINDKGKILWTKTYGDAYEYWDAEAVSETQNGDFFLVGYKQDNNDTKHLLAIRTNALGNMSDKYIFENEQQAALAIQKTDDNNFIIAGYEIQNDDKDGLILKMTENFVVLWSRTYGGSNTDIFRTVELTDKNIYVGGYTRSHSYNNDKDIWILKLDQNGKLKSK